jgi:hypothetical protein
MNLAGRPMTAPRLLKGKALRGCNVYGLPSVYVQRVDLGELSDLRTGDAGQEFAARFVERFAGFEGVIPRGRLREGFLARLNRATGAPLSEALLEAILAVERFVACTMRRLDTPDLAEIHPRPKSPQIVDLVWECHSAGISRAAAATGFAGFLELLPDRLSPPASGSTKDFATLLSKLRRRSLRRQLSPTTAVLAHAARKRGLPCELLAGAYLRLGDGAAQRLISASAPGFACRTEGVAAPPGKTHDVEIIAGAPVVGALHRLLVVDGRVVSALRVDEPVVTGDGTGTVERGAAHSDVTETVHPDNLDAAVRAAATRGQAVAGVNFVTEDIGRSHRESAGRITAVMTQPELSMHAMPAHGEPQDVGGAVLELIFPSSVSASVPTALIVGQRGTSSIARELDGFLRALGRAVGLASRRRSTLFGKRLDPSSVGRRGAANFLLRDPRVEMLVHAVSPRTIVELGLRLNSSTVTAILDPETGGNPGLYRRGIDVGVTATTGAVVIGAGNPHAERLMDLLGPQRLILMSPRGESPLVTRHLAAGGCAVLRKQRDHGEIVELHRRDELVATVPVSLLRPGKKGISERRIIGLMCTTALAFGLGLTGAEIEAAVQRRRFLRR